jgi:hypothetical protein
MRYLFVVALLAGCWRASEPRVVPPSEPAYSDPPEKRRPARAEVPDPPPRPAGLPPAQPWATPSQAMTVRIVGMSIIGATVRVIVAAGSNQGVTTSWTATFVDANGVPVPNGGIVILRVSSTTLDGETTLTFQQIKSSPRVLLQP